MDLGYLVRGKMYVEREGRGPVNKAKTVFLFRAAPAAHGSSQARGRIRAAAAGLYHSHSHMGTEPHLPATPQLTAVPDP